MEPTTYKIPEWNVDDVKARIDALNKKARKLGCQEIALRETGEEFLEIKRRDEWGEPLPPRTVRLVLCEVTGEAPTLNGWAFIGTVEHDPMGEGANILRIIDGYTAPEQYRFTPPQCEHCHRVRQRRDTFIVQHEDGTVKQVGRQCLKDFLGYNDPHQIARLAEAIASLHMDLGTTDEDALWGGGPRGRFYYTPDEYLPWVAASIRAFGWLSGGEARDYHKESTANSAFYAMTERDQTKVKAEAKPTEADGELAEAALAWIRGVEEGWYTGNDYRTNIYYLAQRQYLEGRDRGLVASIITTYQKEMQIEIERRRAKNRPSTHIGEVGKRHTWTLTCSRVFETDGGMYGPTFITSFLEGEGNRVVWFASGLPRYDTDHGWEELQPGDIVEVKATVKEHGEYHGIPQTVVTRAKILRKVGEVATAGEDTPAA